jgi:hypothetical protein
MGEDKTGIAECDEFIATLENELKSEDADFVTRNIVYYFKQQIAIQAKADIANKTPEEKAELASQCKQMATQLKENLKESKK